MLHTRRRNPSMCQLISAPLRSKGELMLYPWWRGSQIMRQLLLLCSHQHLRLCQLL